MQIQSRSRSPRVLRASAAGLGLALLAGAAGAQGFSTETFGSASGDVPLRGLGLVLELVDADTEAPRLRLFGGIPGHPATILVSTIPAESPVAGPRRTRFLVAGAPHAFQGTFDARGTFEAPVDGLERLPQGLTVHAQGLHTAILAFSDGPLVQASHGLTFERRTDETAALGFDDLLPHLPAQRGLEGVGDLAELLQTALDSAGDSLRLAFEIEVTVGLGIEVVEAKAGGKIELEATVTRTAEGRYEVEVAADLAALVGAGAGAGAEVGVEGSGGYGGTRVFSFHSAPGAARGLLGLALALQYPAFQPGKDVAESEAMQRAVERMTELQETLNALREHSAELEAFLWEVVDARLAEAERFHQRARRDLDAALRALANASWRELPGSLARVAVRRAVVAASSAGLKAAHAARSQAEAVLAQARERAEARRAELDRLLAAVARVGRVASAVAQLRGYTTDHYTGWELRYGSAGEAEAKLGLPVVDVKGLESSAQAEVGAGIRVRREVARDGQPGRTTVFAAYELKSELVGALVAGFELTTVRKLEVAQAFVDAPGGFASAGATVTFGTDTCNLATVGLGLQYEAGVGRAWSVSLSDSMFLSGEGLATLTSPTALVERFGAMEVALELQDRRQQNLDFGFSVDVTGNGGGIEIAAEWADQGRLLARSATLAEAIGQVVEGALQAIDPATGAIVAAP